MFSNDQMKDKLSAFREQNKDPAKVAAVERNKRRIVKPKEPPKELKVEHGAVWILEVLTPDMAQEFLDKQHPGQRTLRANHVDALTRSMASGTYVWTGDPIRFDEKNQLIDGQHRLTAVVRSEVTLREVLCVRVSDAEVHKYIDTSIKTRSAADIRRFLGQKQVSGSIVAAIALEFCDFKKSNRVLLTRVEVNELAETCEYMNELIELSGLSRGRVKLTAVGLGVALRCMRRNYDKSMQFFRAVCSNSYMIDGEFHPIIKMTIDWLIRESQARTVTRGADQRAGLEDLAVANKLLRAYNAWRNRENITKLQQPKNDDLIIPRD